MRERWGSVGGGITVQSALLVSFYAIPMAVAPAIGWALGGSPVLRLRYWLAVGCASAAAGFFALALAPVAVPPFAGISCVATGTAVVIATLTPSLSQTVAPDRHGSAFGIWSASQNGAQVLLIAMGVWWGEGGSENVAVMFEEDEHGWTVADYPVTPTHAAAARCCRLLARTPPSVFMAHSRVRASTPPPPPPTSTTPTT